MQNIIPQDEKIVKVEQIEYFDLRIGSLNGVFCLFFFLGHTVNNDQLLPDISVIFVLRLNLLKCPINSGLFPRVLAHILEY
jgi:hypothetical protein